MIHDDYFERFETQKYQNDNPLQRALIRRYVATLHDMFIEAGPVSSVLDVGVGEGFVSGYLSEQLPTIRFTGVDMSASDIALLRAKFPRIEAHQGSAYDLGGLPQGYDLVLCAEVLEHLDSPARALDEMLARRPRRLLLTVPHEPFFMLSNLARGKNVTRFGNDLDHKNHWGPAAFRALLETRLSVLRLATSYPWLLAMAAPR